METDQNHYWYKQFCYEWKHVAGDTKFEGFETNESGDRLFEIRAELKGDCITWTCSDIAKSDNVVAAHETKARTRRRFVHIELVGMPYRGSMLDKIITKSVVTKKVHDKGQHDESGLVSRNENRVGYLFVVGTSFNSHLSTIPRTSNGVSHLSRGLF